MALFFMILLWFSIVILTLLTLHEVLKKYIAWVVEDYLEKCLDSLTGQTLKEIEILAVNDGSTDSSPEILERYADKFSSIIVLNKENGGLSDARNYAFPFIQGEYVGFVDSDDYVDLEMYEAMYKKAVEPLQIL